MNVAHICFFYLHQNQLIPEDKREDVVSHIVMVHQSVGNYSKLFQQRLRRNNYVTPKNYLDFINSYLKLLEEKDKFILSLVCIIYLRSYFIQAKFCPCLICL